jgi:hypothetical protein
MFVVVIENSSHQQRCVSVAITGWCMTAATKAQCTSTTTTTTTTIAHSPLSTENASTINWNCFETSTLFGFLYGCKACSKQRSHAESTISNIDRNRTLHHWANRVRTVLLVHWRCWPVSSCGTYLRKGMIGCMDLLSRCILGNTKNLVVRQFPSCHCDAISSITNDPIGQSPSHFWQCQTERLKDEKTRAITEYERERECV